MKPKQSIFMQWMVRISCAIAFLFVGFAHQAPAFVKDSFVPAEFAEYVLPDGTLPVICTGGSKHAVDQHGKAHSHGCEACRIAASTLLPLPNSADVVSLRINTGVTLPMMPEARNEEPFPPNKGPRAPPQIPVFG